jgi:hypothetical protein
MTQALGALGATRVTVRSDNDGDGSCAQGQRDHGWC